MGCDGLYIETKDLRVTLECCNILLGRQNIPMSISDSYYKNKTKLKNFHISLLISFGLCFVLYIFAYFKFMFLYKIFFGVLFLSVLHCFYRVLILHNHVKDKMKEKRKNGIKPVFDIDIIED